MGSDNPCDKDQGRGAPAPRRPIGGDGGSLRFLERSGARRRILIHVNNTNPILREDSAERRAVAAAGVEVAEDGMELTL